MPVEHPLFEVEPAEYGAGPMEQAISRSLEAQTERIANDPTLYARCRLAIALAQNIDKGNRKGRAIGNEALQLDAVLDKIAGVDTGDETELDALPEDVKLLYAALGQLP